jgi:hypothetical protein
LGFGECSPFCVAREVAERAAVNRRRKKIKLPDAIILATAEVAKRQLVTRNVKDFPAGMRGVRVPYKDLREAVRALRMPTSRNQDMEHRPCLICSSYIFAYRRD